MHIASAKIPKPSAPSDPPRHVAPVAHGMTTTSPPAYEGHQEYTHTRTHAATSNATHAAVIHACLPSDHDQVPHVYELCGMQHACPCPCIVYMLCAERHAQAHIPPAYGCIHASSCASAYAYANLQHERPQYRWAGAGPRMSPRASVTVRAHQTEQRPSKQAEA